MNLQTASVKQNTMCMCMWMCCFMSDPATLDSGNREAVNLRVRCLP